MTVRPLIAGNWKMNGLSAAIDEANALAEALSQSPAHADVAICPPATLIAKLAWALQDSVIAVGGQDCHAKESGAYTGDISAAMLADAGATLVILGHSERRAYHHEYDSDVAAKAQAALTAGLKPVVCVGETLEERQAGDTLAVIEAQITGSLPVALANAEFAVAYEPCWAIGSGLTPTLEQIAQVHGAIRQLLVGRLGQGGAVAPILYGGSVKPDNAAEIFKVAEVGGGLIGGASLKAEDFLQIIRAI
jgi:triosephosphate isomerase